VRRAVLGKGKGCEKDSFAQSPAESVLMTKQPEKKKPLRKVGETFSYIFHAAMDKAAAAESPSPSKSQPKEPRSPAEPQAPARSGADRKSKLNLDKLCRLGCEEAELCKLLFGVVSLEFSEKGQDKIIPGITDGELGKLSRDLGKLAQTIEDANKIFLPHLEALPRGSAQHRALGAFTFTFTPLWPAFIYESLPTIMRDFAKDLQYMFAHDRRPLIGKAENAPGSLAREAEGLGSSQPVGFYREILRNCSTKDDWALLGLLSYVRSKTRGPNYPAVAYLLRWAFNAVRTQLGSSLVMQTRFGSAEALRKFYDNAPVHLKAWVAKKL
jgi:hypothetical protein